MKILRRGKTIKKPWFGKVLICKECGCRFKLVKGDPVRVEYFGERGERIEYEVNCPSEYCDELIKFNCGPPK